MEETGDKSTNVTSDGTAEKEPYRRVRQRNRRLRKRKEKSEQASSGGEMNTCQPTEPPMTVAETTESEPSRRVRQRNRRSRKRKEGKGQMYTASEKNDRQTESSDDGLNTGSVIGNSLIDDTEHQKKILATDHEAGSSSPGSSRHLEDQIVMADSAAGEECKHEGKPEKMSDEESDLEDIDSIYEVEKIVGISKEGEKTLYKVRWKGYSPDADTWEPKDNLLTCEDLIDEYVAKEEKKKASKGPSKSQRPEKEASKTPAKEKHAQKRSTGHHKKRKKKRMKYEQETPSAYEARDRKKSNSTDEDGGNEEKGRKEKEDKKQEEIEGTGNDGIKKTLPPRRKPVQTPMLVEEEEEEEKGEKDNEGESAVGGGETTGGETTEVTGDGGEITGGGEKTGGGGEKEGGDEGKKIGEPIEVDVPRSDEQLLKDPFWDQLEKGLIEVSFETDMYSKVKNRRAFLDAKREEEEEKQKKKEKKAHKKEKKAKKDKKDKHDHKHKHKGQKKTKKMVDLEMLGSLESATKRTLMMSPTALDTSANSANLYKSMLPSEHVLTIAQLEEKSNQERAASSTSGLSTPCKLETSSSQSSSSTSSVTSQEAPNMPDSPPSEKTPDPHAAFFGDLCSLDVAKVEPIEPEELKDIAKVLPTPEVDDGDRQDPMTIASASPGSDALVKGSFTVQGASTDKAGKNITRETSKENLLQHLPKGAVEVKPFTNLPTPPEVDNKTVLNVVQSSSSSMATCSDSSKSSEHFKEDYKLKETNLLEKARQPMGNVQASLDDARNIGTVGENSSGKQGQEPVQSSNFQPPTPPTASLFSSFNLSTPKASPLLPLSDGAANKQTTNLKSPQTPLSVTTHMPIAIPTPVSTPLTPQSTPSPKTYQASQKSPNLFPTGPTASGSRSGDRNAFEKLQSFQLSSASGRNSAKVQSLKDKLSKLVSPGGARREDSAAQEKAVGDMKLDQQQHQLQQQSNRHLSELRIDTSLANVYRTPPSSSSSTTDLSTAGQPQPLTEIERQIQRIDARDVTPPSHMDIAVTQSLSATQEVSQSSYEESLRQAIKAGNVQAVVNLLQQMGPRALEEVDSLGTTPLMLACSGGQDAIVKALVLNGAVVNKSHKNGLTPLMMAAEKGFTSTVGILLEAGAYINITTPSGESALMQASRKGHRDVVRLLLEYGANWMVTSRDGSSALGYALHYNHQNIQNVLHSHVQRLCCELEATASQFLFGTARLLKLVFPLHCYRLREATEHVALVSFDASNYYCFQGNGMLLLLAQATLGPGWNISCKLSGSSYIKQVLLNGKYMSQLTQGSNFVLSYTPRSGQNVLTISTVPDPYTNTLLLVAAYSVQIGGHTH